ncbi:MAG: DNA mismatch repair endonuclease MutL [Clostridiales Family XIII bacterium]|jgi:DNA mismatch repair protein MutL|nr:DNA mismatch repair endonuclease MutL [Clostridiales Family XIII bacterium]
MTRKTNKETMGAHGIRQLPKNISDKIAAGEVVTSPLSVVKELVENSIDAGAGHIAVEIENGGKSYIRVTDDGSGIPPSEAELAFAQHSTSKIRDEADLDSIATLGFRGEALASIAAVSRLEMVTKVPGSATATRVGIEGGELVETGPVGAPDGTTVTVRHLFYNTPARLKFMKTDRGETTKVTDFMSRMAVAYPGKAMRLITNGTALFSTPGKGDIRKAILTVFGTSAGEDLIELHSESPGQGGRGGMGLAAWIGDPNHSAKTRKAQMFFVNGRYVKDEIIAGAVAEAYREFMFEGRYPIAYIFLDVHPSLVDVNVHPTKSEIKFADGAAVRAFIKEAILSALMSEAGVPRAHTAKQFAASRRAEREFYRYAPESDTGRPLASGDGERPGDDGAPHDAEGPEAGPGADAAEEDRAGIVKISGLWGSEGGAGAVGGLAAYGPESYESDAAPTGEVREPAGEGRAYSVQQEVRIDSLGVLGAVFGSYIVATDDDNLYIIDWHAAHERVNFERFMAAYRSREKLSQELLTPQILRLPAVAKARATEWAAWLAGAGFTAEIFGDGSLIIKSAPAFLGMDEALRYAGDMIEAGGKTPPDDDKAVARIISRACRSSVKANSAIKTDEANALIRDLALCENPYTCPHGRPVFIKYSRRQLEKLFKRV